MTKYNILVSWDKLIILCRLLFKLLWRDTEFNNIRSDLQGSTKWLYFMKHPFSGWFTADKSVLIHQHFNRHLCVWIQNLKYIKNQFSKCLLSFDLHILFSLDISSSTYAKIVYFCVKKPSWLKKRVKPYT